MGPALGTAARLHRCPALGKTPNLQAKAALPGLTGLRGGPAPNPWSTGRGDSFPWVHDAILAIFTTLRPAEPRHEVQRLGFANILYFLMVQPC